MPNKVYSIPRRTKKQNNKKYKKTKKVNPKNQKHYYFIVDCKYNNLVNLKNKYLEQHLHKLGLKQDKYINKYEANKKEFIRTHGISNEDFCKKTKKINFKPNKDNLIADVFFYYMNGMHLNKPFYNYSKFLVNVLNINYMETVNKNIIYDNVYNIDAELAKKYFIETFPIHHKEKYQFPNNYILRPNDAFGGNDILYIKNEKELEDAINYYKKTKNYRGVLYKNDVIASKFITNLLLFKEKKFHIRMYYLVSVINNIFNSFLLKYGEILTAKQKYNLDEPFIMDVHDTHGSAKTVDEYAYFPGDLLSSTLSINLDKNNVNTIYDKCKIMCSGISKVLQKEHITNGLLYPNQQNGYYLFGIDVMIRDNLEPVLIECNIQPAFSTDSIKTIDKFSYIIYNFINDVVLEPLFKYNDPMRARKHHTYIELE